MSERADRAALVVTLLVPPALLALAGGGAASSAAEAAAAPSTGAATAALRAADAALHPIREGVIRVRSTMMQPGALPSVSVSVVDVYVQGPERVLCVFREGPLSERRILTAGRKTWLIVPGSERAIPVSAGQRLLGGASVADVARIHFEDGFDATERPEDERVGDTWCRVLDLRARDRKASYATAILWIDRRDRLARRVVLRLASGTIAKEMLFTSYGRGPTGPAVERMRILHRLPSEQGMETEL